MIYNLNKRRLYEFYDDFLELEDWIPTIIFENFPHDIFTKWGKTSTPLRAKREMDHKRAKEDFDFNHPDLPYEAADDWECQLFIDKYPYFRNLFIINSNYEYPEVKPITKEERYKIMRSMGMIVKEPKKGLWGRITSIFSRN